MPSLIKLLGFLLCLSAMAEAQVTATLRLNKSQYIAGEPVVAVISVTNHAGRELVFQGDGRRDWLEILVRNNRGNPVNTRARTPFGAMRIAAGQTLAREVDLSQLFMLHEAGNFNVSAVVRTLGSNEIHSNTNRAIFTINPGRVFWSQKAGVPNRPRETREFRVLQHSGGQRNQLYAQVIEDRTGMPLRTFVLGDALSLRRPSVTLDRNQRMHVIFLSTPVMWVHYVIDIDGNVVNRDIHQRGAQGDPRLVTLPDGTVQVSNSVPYDPAGAARARARIRNISERPDVVYR